MADIPSPASRAAATAARLNDQFDYEDKPAYVITGVDRDLIARVVATEVDHRLAKSDPDEYYRQIQGVVDTVMNRAASGKFGGSVAAVINQKNQFSAINGPTGRGYEVYGSVQNVPDKRVPTQTRTLVNKWIDSRIGGARSSVQGGLHYANPSFSDAKNLSWINALDGPQYGRGNSVHHHGTMQGYEPYEARVVAPKSTAREKLQAIHDRREAVPEAPPPPPRARPANAPTGNGPIPPRNIPNVAPRPATASQRIAQQRTQVFIDQQKANAPAVQQVEIAANVGLGTLLGTRWPITLKDGSTYSTAAAASAHGQVIASADSAWGANKGPAPHALEPGNDPMVIGRNGPIPLDNPMAEPPQPEYLPEQPVPVSMRVFADTVAGGRSTVTAQNFSRSELVALEAAVQNAEADGRDFIVYQDYGKGTKAGVNMGRLWDAQQAVAATIGMAKFSRQSDGTIRITDTYDWNTGRGEGKEVLAGLVDGGVPGFLEALGSQVMPEGEGRKVKVQWKPLTPRPNYSPDDRQVINDKATENRRIDAALANAKGAPIPAPRLDRSRPKGPQFGEVVTAAKTGKVVEAMKPAPASAKPAVKMTPAKTTGSAVGTTAGSVKMAADRPPSIPTNYDDLAPPVKAVDPREALNAGMKGRGIPANRTGSTFIDANGKRTEFAVVPPKAAAVAPTKSVAVAPSKTVVGRDDPPMMVINPATGWPVLFSAKPAALPAPKPLSAPKSLGKVDPIGKAPTASGIRQEVGVKRTPEEIGAPDWTVADPGLDTPPVFSVAPTGQQIQFAGRLSEMNNPFMRTINGGLSNFLKEYRPPRPSKVSPVAGENIYDDVTGAWRMRTPKEMQKPGKVTTQTIPHVAPMYTPPKKVTPTVAAPAQPAPVGNVSGTKSFDGEHFYSGNTPGAYYDADTGWHTDGERPYNSGGSSGLTGGPGAG